MKTRKSRISESAAIAEVRTVYKDLETIPVERHCTSQAGCCKFKLTGRVPHLTRGEALLAARGWRATGRKSLVTRIDGSCPMLDCESGRCLIYEMRPFGCRTHFCRAAGGPYERQTVIDLIRKLENVDASLGGSGAHPLEKAVSAELAKMQ